MDIMLFEKLGLVSIRSFEFRPFVVNPYFLNILFLAYFKTEIGVFLQQLTSLFSTDSVTCLVLKKEFERNMTSFFSKKKI
jgi:hypothetical protein